MGTKTISLADDAYEKLRQKKRGTERASATSFGVSLATSHSRITTAYSTKREQTT